MSTAHIMKPAIRRLAVLTRNFSTSGAVLRPRPTQASAAISASIRTPRHASNPQMAFPCLDKREQKSQALLNEGPEPAYSKIGRESVHIYKSEEPIFLDYGGFLPGFQIAYESWGILNADASNAILIHTGLSASSHAKSNSLNQKSGWWEEFIGPGKYLDTDRYFVVCTNVIGGCYGSTGPSSVDPADGDRYATRFPILSVNDMVRAQHRLISQHFGVKKLYASIGASMGGMQSLAYAQEFTDEVEKVISISGCAKSHPYSIAMRHCQRQVLMSDPNWNRGFYYDSLPPHTGMKLSREIATITYRSGPEWETRFGTERADPSKQPALCPDFLIETYLDHQGEKFCLEYDANSLLYISKAMDLFNLSKTNRDKAEETRLGSEARFTGESTRDIKFSSSECALPNEPYTEKPRRRVVSFEEEKDDLRQGLEKFAHKDVLVIGVESDILFPVWQQREISQFLKESAKKLGISNGDNIRHVELGEDISMYGHDTFLLSLDYIGQPVRDFLG